jgi:hypothetical protein
MQVLGRGASVAAYGGDVTPFFPATRPGVFLKSQKVER